MRVLTIFFKIMSSCCALLSPIVYWHPESLQPAPIIPNNCNWKHALICIFFSEIPAKLANMDNCSKAKKPRIFSFFIIIFKYFFTIWTEICLIFIFFSFKMGIQNKQVISKEHFS